VRASMPSLAVPTAAADTAGMATHGVWPGEANRQVEPRNNRWALVALGLVIAAVAGPVLGGALVDCWNDENYSHGVLVPLLVALLVHRRRSDSSGLAATARSRWQAFAWMLLGAGAAGFVIGSAAAEQFIQRTSCVALVTAAVGIAFGPRRFRQTMPAFALGVCMVPLPYIVYYALTLPLQLLSTQWAAGGVALLGFDVTRDGNIFTVNGSALEVVRACSGIRSIMALATVAVAGAVWTRLGPGRAAFLILASVPAAVAGNVLRLMVTGLLVARFGPHLAEGTAHEMVGVACFGVSLALLAGVVAILQRGRQPDPPPPARPQASWAARARAALQAARPASSRQAWIAAVSLAAVGGYAIFLQQHRVTPSEEVRLESVPLTLGDLNAVEIGLDERVQEQVAPSSFVFRSYASPVGTDFALYAGYYRNPARGVQIHSPLHCYPGAGWKILGNEPLSVRDLHGEPTTMQRLVVQKRGRRDVVVYWYETRAGRTTNDYALKFAQLRTSLLRQPQDAAFVRWSTPLQDGETLDDATRRLLGVVGRSLPAIESALPFRDA